MSSSETPAMIDASQIREHMEVVGADGVHVGIVDHLDGDRVKLAKNDPDHGIQRDHHHYVPLANFSSVDQGKLWLSSNAADADILEEEEDGKPVND